jgi:hypothetical protein
MEPTFAIYPATALDGNVFRAVGENPPTPRDFLSYEYAGRAYPAREFFRATGVSMHTTRKAAECAKRQWGLGDYMAELDLREFDWILAPWRIARELRLGGEFRHGFRVRRRPISPLVA